MKNWTQRARNRLWNEAAIEKGILLNGTPARYPQDIAAYVTLSAFHRLTGRPAPRALGRPDIGPCAWFASLETARAIGRRFQGLVETDFFAQILRHIPSTIYRDPGYHRFSGKIHSTGEGAVSYSCFAALIPAKNRIAPEEQRFAVFFRPTIDRPWATAEEDLLVTGLVFDDAVIGLGIFRKHRTESLYRAILFGLHPQFAGKNTEPPFVRPARVLFRQYTRAIFDYPEVSYDFTGGITPAAAMRAHSLFRDAVGRECRRLKALDPAAAAQERKRVETYPYPAFDAEQRVGRIDLVRAGLKHAARRMISLGRRIVTAGRPERKTVC